MDIFIRLLVELASDYGRLSMNWPFSKHIIIKKVFKFATFILFIKVSTGHSKVEWFKACEYHLRTRRRTLLWHTHNEHIVLLEGAVTPKCRFFVLSWKQSKNQEYVIDIYYAKVYDDMLNDNYRHHCHEPVQCINFMAL